MNKYQTSIQLMLVVFTIVMLMACDHTRKPPTPTVNPMENSARERNGLRTIKPHWYFYWYEFNEETWKCHQGEPLAKKIYRKPDGPIAWDQDYYYSGRKFLNSQGSTSDEVVSLYYSYGRKKLYVDVITDSPAAEYLINKLDSTVNGYAGRTNEETVETAQKIMESMKIIPAGLTMEEAVNVETK